MSRQEERNDAVAGGLSDGREGAVDRGADGQRGERDGGVRTVGHQPQDRLQVAFAISAARRGGTERAVARSARGAVNDKRGPGAGNHGSAAGASELGTQEAAGEA